MRLRSSSVGVLSATVIVRALVAQVPSQLTMGSPVEQSIEAAAMHPYLVRLAPGEFAHVVVRQSSGAVSLAVFDSRGRMLGHVDYSEPPGEHWVFLLAEALGEYRVEVRSTGRGGRYRAELVELRSASAQDRILVAAQMATFEAERAGKLQSKESNAQARQAYERAIELWQKANHLPGQAYTQLQLGLFHFALGDYKRAADFLQRSVDLYHRQRDIAGQSKALCHLADARVGLGSQTEARNHLEEAMMLASRSGSPLAEARARLSLGGWMLGAGRPADSIPLLEQSLSLFRQAGSQSDLTGPLGGLGRAHDLLGNYPKALEYYEELLPIARNTGNRNSEEFVLNNIAIVNLNLGDVQTALERYNSALSVTRTTGNRAQEAVTLANIGVAHAQLGDFESALDFVQRAVRIHRSTGFQTGLAYSLDYLCNLRRRRQEAAQALAHCEESLSIRRSSGDRIGQGNSLKELGLTYLELHDWTTAAARLKEARDLARASGDRLLQIQTLIGLARAWTESHREVEARAAYEEALDLSISTGDPAREAMTRLWLARLARRATEYDSAKSHLANAVTQIETLRSRIAADRLRTTFLARNAEIYEEYIGVLMDEDRRNPGRGSATAAFQVSERAHARSLLEALSEVRTGIREGADPGLIDRERRLRRQLNAAMRSPGPALKVLLSELETLDSELKKSSPRFAALVRPEPLNIAAVQEELDGSTLLIEYSLGANASYAWLVSRQAVQGYQLPARAEIEAAAKHLSALLATRGGEDLLAVANARLSRLVLGPLASELGYKRLAIVADGALHLVSFASLTVPGAKVPLGLQHEIAMLPSASALAATRKEAGSRSGIRGSLAVLADPVFDREDSRVASHARGTLTSSLAGDLARAATSAGMLSPSSRVPRLPFARREAEAILSLAPPRQNLRALDFDASRPVALSPEMRAYKIVHFATHGIVNNEHPELSGLILSLVDRQGVTQDGFLRLVDIYNLRLAADLVVLSACETGAGKQVRGEGVISLARGFFYAGVPRVVASLWRVNDRAAAEIMRRFYEGILGPKRLTVGAALRDAQISMSKDPRWRHPYFWAGFVLHGDWR